MPFVLPVVVRPDDIDDLEHVNNLVYIKWIQDVAVAHSQALGLGFPEYLARRQAFIIRRHEVDYLRAARTGDAIEVETRVSDLRLASSTRQTEIRRAGASPQDKVLFARAITGWAYVDLDTGRPVRIPDEVRSRFPLDTPFDWSLSHKV